MKKIISAHSISKAFHLAKNKETVALHDLSLEINEGEYLAIEGPSGAGKSTLLYLLGSLDNPDKGQIKAKLSGVEYEYAKMSANAIAEFRNKNIGFVFQFHHLLPEFTAYENIMIPALIAGHSKKSAKIKSLELLESVGLIERAQHKPSELSGGEQQRVAIARALINNPSIVLADEPTGNLDSKNSQAALDLISDIRKKYNITFVVATHSAEVSERAERVVVIQDGKIKNT